MFHLTLVGWLVDFWWAPIHVPYSDYFHLQIHRFVDSQLHVETCVLQAVIISNRTLSFEKKIGGHKSSAWWDYKIKPDFYFINGELKPQNALRNVRLSDCILNLYKELALSFHSASWWTQIDDLTLTRALVKRRKNIFLYFFTELKIYHLSYFKLAFYHVFHTHGVKSR